MTQLSVGDWGIEVVVGVKGKGSLQGGAPGFLPG